MLQSLRALEASFAFGNTAQVVGPNIAPDFITYAAILGFIVIPFAVWYFMKPKANLRNAEYSADELNIPMGQTEQKQEKDVA